MSNPIIEVKEVNLNFNTQVALKNITFCINEGEFVALIGPNGGGKTTLLKVILGVLKPDSGEVQVCAKNPQEALPLMGYVPQNT
ncbi:MAG: ATP-binding cassette domain-containing protein, partial [Campylobacterales bacterium]